MAGRTPAPGAPENRLAREASPYLRQHATNPVDWWPWCEEALAKARELDRPIFLSIGYSACHWCHVMEEESFANPEIAALMNDLFINIKVDREERPDIDAIYMSAVVHMTGSGGWPMSVWLTPDLKPFYAGTYFPPDDRAFGYGRPGFPTLCKAIAEAWQKRRPALEKAAAAAVEDLAMQATLASGEHVAVPAETLRVAMRGFASRFDSTYGGTLGAPKFPPSMHLAMLLRAWHRFGDAKALEMVTITLDRMALSGTYDQLGGGFHRYSTDERWLVPHFEKMLYDNALLLRAYSEGFAATGNPLYQRIADEIVRYVAREMTDASGAFYSTQDADSEGEEGRFFSWTPTQLREVLGDADGDFAARAWGVTEGGNFEHGTSVLSRVATDEDLAKHAGCTPAEAAARLERCRAALWAARENRIKPHRDEKILVSWNGLMIAGLAAAARHALLGPEPLAMARRAADTMLARAMNAEGRLRAVLFGDEARLNGYLDDYAYLAWGLIELAALTGEWRYLDAATRLHVALAKHFADDAGGFFFTSDDHEALILRTKDPMDNATPSGNSVAAMNLLLLHELTGDAQWLAQAQGTIGAVSEMLVQSGANFPQMMLAADWLAGPAETLVVSGEGTDADALEAEARRGFAPRRIVVRVHDPAAPGAPAIARDKAGPAAYLCRNFACQAPARTPEALRAQLDTTTPSAPVNR